ncbi:MAG: hypothetical protein AAB601_01230, partial [Patescibacteria group bacterium]
HTVEAGHRANTKRLHVLHPQISGDRCRKKQSEGKRDCPSLGFSARAEPGHQTRYHGHGNAAPEKHYGDHISSF